MVLTVCKLQIRWVFILKKKKINYLGIYHVLDSEFVLIFVLLRLQGMIKGFPSLRKRVQLFFKVPLTIFYVLPLLTS